ncbi:hypothetical protein [Allorhizocola rhizosphaerae]|uniref:hypothetical protein n=1 Tax=Allorhizocola rhizosphaerae TaxID=1872709 RepID=UPI000E3C936C|nr:hypothetical protein [Allorhizocola rhizosphaerae]
MVPPARFRNAQEEAIGGDQFSVRLAKYVPAETLAFFVPVAAALGAEHNKMLVAALVVGLVGTVLYLWLAAQRAEPDERPLPHFYFLAAAAYLCWTVGTSPNVAALIQLNATVGGVVLTGAVFLVPMLDEVGNRLLRQST